MSLLMDALRRAEAEKQQQEAREGRSRTPAEPEAGAGDETRPAAAPAGPVPDAPADETSLELELEIDAFTAKERDSGSVTFGDDLALEPMDEAAADGRVADDDTRTGTHSGLAGPAGEGGGPEQTATMPSNRAVKRDLEAYFDRSQSIEAPRRRLLGDQTLEDVAAHTMVGARTVFAATERPRSRRIVMVAAILGVAVVVAIGALGVYFAQQTPGRRAMPSPAVANGVERSAPRELPVVALEPRRSGASAALARVDTDVAAAPESGTPDVAPAETAPEAESSSIAPADATPAVAPDSAEAPFDTLASSGGASPSAAPSPATVTPSLPPTAGTVAPSDSAGAAVAAGDGTRNVAEDAAEAVARDVERSVIEGVGRGEVRIARSVRPAGVDADLGAAYAAWQAGDVEAARARYTALLAKNPDRRDALLGLAGVALQAGDLAVAYRHYATVLRRFPDDPVASAALLTLTGGEGADSIARVRMLLDRHGGAADVPAFIHFALGNTYVRQERWADAQQAYFDAVRLDADNPDYTYNLAVALDQMGQHDAALEYYRRSLTLADNVPAAFNPASVLERIGALGAAE